MHIHRGVDDLINVIETNNRPTQRQAPGSLERHLTRFCQQTEFKRYVREAISDELFWKQIFEDMRVRNLVSNQIEDQMPRKVASFLENHLPGRITQEILRQLPHILDNNHAMQQILSQHSERLHELLAKAARTLLEAIVNEDQYHEVNRTYFEAFERRTEKAIKAFNDRSDGEMRQLRQQLDSVSQLRERLNGLQCWVYSLSALTAGALGVLALQTCL